MGSRPSLSKVSKQSFLLQEVLFALDVHAVGVREYGHNRAQAQESLLDSGASNKAVFNLERLRSGKKYVAMVTL